MGMIYQFLISVLVFIGLDYLWIGVVMKNFYLDALGALARTANGAFKPHVSAMIGVYVALAFLTTFFVVPAFRALGMSWQTILIAFGFGVGLYAFYDLTNLAILKDWPMKVVVIDIIWGGVLVALGTVISLFIKDFIF